MKKEPLLIAFASQKGGVGKSAFTVLVASILHYQKGLKVGVVDCDSPQHSISRMRDRDIESVQESDFLKVVLYRQHEQIRKRSYPVIKSNPEKAIEDLYRYIEEQDAVFDVVLFDLPGTLRSEGVVHTISAIDYIFIPLKADNVVMQSSLQFAEVVEEELIARHNCNLKGIYLFWNMVDKRERTESYESWNRVIQKAELHLLESRIPDTKRYNKELSSLKNSIFRSTLFPPDNRQIKGSGLCRNTSGCLPYLIIKGIMDSGKKKFDPRSIDEKAILDIVARKGTIRPDSPATSVSPKPEDTAEEIAGSSEAPVFTTGEIDAYRASFLNTVRTKSRKSLHIDADLHRRISSLVWAVGRGEVTVAGFVNQVLAHHFEENGGLINAVLEKYYQSLKS